MIAKLSIKNIWRNKRRTMITLAVITIGVSMVCLAMAYVEFVKWGYGESIIHGQTGHFQVLSGDLLTKEEDKILSYGIADWSKLAAQIKEDPRVSVVTPRINFFGLCSTGEKSNAVTRRPCRASHTELRPSPSETQRAVMPGTRRAAWEARNAFGAVPK